MRLHILVGAGSRLMQKVATPIARLLLDRVLGVEHQVLAVVHVDVVRLAVGDQQDQLARDAPITAEKCPAWRNAVPMRVESCPVMPASRARACSAIRLVEVLEAVVLDLVTAVGVEAVNGEAVADLVHRVGHQRSRFAREVEHGRPCARDVVVGRLRQVQQQEHREIAAALALPLVHARIGRAARAQIDRRR